MNSSSPGTLAITMAGLSSRFTKAGYTRPKYEIEVLGRPLFDWSMVGLSAFIASGWSCAFATRREEDAAPFLRERCAPLNIPIQTIVELDAVTDGQATTALYLAEQSVQDAPFAVFNIDTFVAANAMRPDLIDPLASGWVPCFPGPGEGWSFARADASGRVLELREKVRISTHATVGFYWFRSAGLYREVYREFFSSGGEEQGEKYIAPMYNYMIARGDLVSLGNLDLDQVGMLGTPDQVEDFASAPSAAALASVGA